MWRYQRGLTLVEIMIAMLLGVLLTGGIVQFFVSNRQTYRIQENLSRIQENGRFAMDFIGRDLRMAGYRECLDIALATPITGTDGSSQPDEVTTRKSTGACPGTTVAIRYFIQDGSLRRQTAPPNSDPDGISDGEVVSGVQDMQILYGADTDSDDTPNYYVPAGTGGLNMSQVVSVRVSLLLASAEDNLADQPQTYLFNGATTTATDRRIRRVFTSTIALRNQLP